LGVATPSGDPVWSEDGKSIYFMTADIPHCNLYKVDLKGKVKAVIEGKTLGGYSVGGGRVAYVAMSGTEPMELYLRDGKDRKLTDFNGKLLRSLSVSPPEHFSFRNRLGRAVDGWMIKPVGWKKGEKYPCILEIHGGPRGAYGDGVFHEFQMLASEGYAVIYTNPRGSSGYEEEYTMAVMRHYGEPDTEDFMDFTDEALRRYGWIDSTRLGVTGGSYGGFAVNWLISHTDRFKAATTDRCVSNWVSKFGTSDIGYQQPESISGEKTYWGEALMEQMRHSPILYAGNVKTPCLILHSEQDLRCPIEQGEQWFTALKLNGVPCEMVRIPDENHELSRAGKPKHREERLRHHLRWFKQYL
jgi:dipeptidyl aminopeptidase/acylaminoacyl peptidase